VVKPVDAKPPLFLRKLLKALTGVFRTLEIVVEASFRTLVTVARGSDELVPPRLKILFDEPDRLGKEGTRLRGDGRFDPCW
jgi:hypothetical protein